MRIRMFKALLIGLTAVVIAGCGGSDSGTDPGAVSKSSVPEGVESAAATAPAADRSMLTPVSANLKGLANSSVIWPMRTINVCWDVDNGLFSSSTQMREVVRQGVTESWQANSELAFMGWDKCQDSSNFHGIRVQIAEDRPHVTAFGKDLDGPTQGVVLNFQYKVWDPLCPAVYGLSNCVKGAAVHEFGHALGFHHEQYRSDGPAWCSDDPSGSLKDILHMDTMIGAWDLASVMNYCNPTLNGVGNLSPTDIEMVQRFYGKPGGTLYLITKQKGPNQEITAYDTMARNKTAAISLTTSPQSLINRVVASPDGKRVYVLSSETANSQITAIDTDTNTVAYVRSNTPLFSIDQMEVSPDSKTLYVFSKSKSSVYLWSAQTGDASGSIAISAPPESTLYRGVRWMAKPQFDNDSIYLLMSYDIDRETEVFAVTQLSVSQRKQIRVIKAGPGEAFYSNIGINIALSTDEKTIYYPMLTASTGPRGGIGALDLATGKIRTIASFKSDTTVGDMLALEGNVLVYGNWKAGNSPSMVDLDSGVTNTIPIPSQYLTIKGYDYLAASNVKSVFSSNISSIWESTLESDGSYSGKMLDIKGNYAAGDLARPLAFAKAH